MKAIRNACSRVFDSVFHRIELSPASDRLLLRTLFFVILFSGAAAIYNLNATHSQETPVRGGTLHEGIVGTPRFVNPVLANTRADHDMTALTYSGLMKIDPEGTLVPHLAESVTMSEDGLTYNIVLRKDIYFHDGTPVTTKDVLYTLRLIQDPDLKSPLRGNWTGVLFEEISDGEMNIVLDEAYAPFIENFTVGILPAHLWSNLPVEQIPFSQLNTEPIGSGPFQVLTAKRDASGVIRGYVLESHREVPNPSEINRLEIVFIETTTELRDKLKNGELDASAYVSNEDIASVLENENLIVVSEPLPRVFGTFFNQNKSVALRDDSVREALSVAINRQEIVDATLYGQGVPITGPTTNVSGGLESGNDSDITPQAEENIAAARVILEEAGWRTDNQGRLEKQIDENTETLEITIRTSNAPLFVEISAIIRRAWEELGVVVTIDQYDQSDLVQTVIRPRDFEILLFGLDMNRSYDLYPFWHSSQKDDPGLNIAQYTNIAVDELLEEARIATSSAERTELQHKASEIIAEEFPAVFLFQPHTTYVVNKNFVIPSLSSLSRPADRFSNMSEWYTDSDTLWNVFR